jgi:hypothetical protein
MNSLKNGSLDNKRFIMAQEAIYTVEDVAKLLAVHPDIVRNWIKSGDLIALELADVLVTASLNLNLMSSLENDKAPREIERSR